MKLSAPPPPPPEPPEPNPGPEANAPAAAEPPPAETPPTPAVAAKPLTWPAWFATADFLLAAMAVVLAFLVASFIARNSDVWLHLAAGKRLFAGEYSLGSDPFSYSAADRPWVNHSWLYDAGAYLLYGGKGVVLGVAKALAVALAFGLLIGIRRPGFSLWPWAAVAAVAVIAAAPQMTLRPIVASMLLLAVTLFLLFRMEHRPGSWRFPVAIGITFWLWANLDGWFLVGPFALALVLVGELIQRNWLKTAEKPDAVEPLGRLPDVPTLVKALVVGLVVCTLTPHHVRVWELPFELVGSPEAKLDPRIKVLLYRPLDSEYTKQPGLGYNVNGLAFGVLFVGGGVALGLGSGRIRIAHLALWIGFALLSLLSLATVPFFAVVAVPLIASQLNGLSSRVQLKTWGDPKTRFILLGSAAGRVACLAAVATACVLTWPGWLHPVGVNPAFARRVNWGVEPDGGLVRAAEQLQAWRAGGQLPPEAHGLIVSTELANHCAWFAPQEKVYLNGRFNHHRPEIPSFVAARSGLMLFYQDQEPEPRKVDELLRNTGAEYLAIATGPGDGELLQEFARRAAQRMWLDADQWSPWYLDGRSTICGWRGSRGAEKPTFAALRVDPAYLAFGPEVVPLPPTETMPVPPEASLAMDFIQGVSLPPPGADEALGWLRYQGVLRQRQTIIEQLARYWSLSTTSPAGMSLPRLANTVVFASWPGSLQGQFADDAALQSTPERVRNEIKTRRQIADDITASTFLALRAARRAIAANPDHPDGYFALATVLAQPNLPLSDAERTIGQLTAYRQCLVRLPPPDRFKPGVYTASPTEAAAQLAYLHLGRQLSPNLYAGVPIDAMTMRVLKGSDGAGFLFEANGQMRFASPTELLQYPPGDQFRIRTSGRPHVLALDLAREYLILANRYAEKELTGDNPQAKQASDGLKNDLKKIESEVVKANTAYVRLSGQAKVRDQVRAALRNNLVGEALRILNDKSTDLVRDFGPDPLEVAATALQWVTLELAMGRLEDVAIGLDRAAATIEAVRATPQARDLAHTLQGLVYEKLLFEGNFGEAGKLTEQFEAAAFEADSAKPLRDKFDPQPFVKMGDRIDYWSELRGLANPAAAFAGPLQPVVLSGTALAALLGFGEHPGFVLLQQNLAGRRNRESEFFVRRGLLSLIEGDIPGARTRFLATRLPAIPEWGIPEQKNSTAELYLRLIDQAAKKGK